MASITSRVHDTGAAQEDEEPRYTDYDYSGECAEAMYEYLGTKSRVEEAVIRQAKLLAKRRGTSVSRIFGDFISAQTEDLPSAEDLALPPITAAMLGSISNYDLDISEKDYYKHLEDKHL